MAAAKSSRQDSGQDPLMGTNVISIWWQQCCLSSITCHLGVASSFGGEKTVVKSGQNGSPSWLRW